MSSSVICVAKTNNVIIKVINVQGMTLASLLPDAKYKGKEEEGDYS